MNNLSTNSLLQGGKYKIEKVLGQGGFGITYLATQTGLNRKVAIKEFFMSEYCERSSDTSHVSIGTGAGRKTVERFRQKFIKEAQTIAEMDNHHIIRIHDIFEENNTAYYVMEYLPGGDLRHRIPKTGLPEQESVWYIRQICDALSYIHSKNILHLDIKPTNILFRAGGEAVLIDFGLSKHYDAEEGHQTSSTPVGVSEGYAPTEQYEREGISSFSASTDIYSLGATLYCLLSGSRPPKAGIVLNEGLPPLPAHISLPVRNAVTAAMQPRRKDRPQSIGEFLKLLDGCSTDEENTTFPDEPIVAEVIAEPVKPQPTPRPAPSPLKKWFLPALVCLGALLAFLLWPKGGNNEPSPVQVVTDSVAPSPAKPVKTDTLSQPPAPVKQTATIRGTINGHDYVDLGLSVKWATCNVGANSPEGYGNYYAWGETKPKNTYTEENCKTWEKQIGDISGNPAYDAATANWGGSWRMPTKAEFQELKDNCTWELTTQGGKKGYKVTSKKNGNSIFFPAAGFRNGSSLNYAGYNGDYWSSTPDESNTQYAYDLYFYSGDRRLDCSSRDYGRSVRPVSE